MKVSRDLFPVCIALVAILFTAKGDDPVVVITQTTPARDLVDDYIKCPKDQDAFLTCAVTNKPTNRDVKWIMTALGSNNTTPVGTDLSSEDPFKYSLEKPSPTAWRLKIQNVQVTDEGRYTCRVQVGSQNYVRAVADIRVTEVPQIADLQTSSDTIVKEGDEVLLNCNATGRPFPLVSWRRLAGELLPTGGRELQEYSLSIRSAKAEHAGSYICSAKNFAGSDARTIRLQVKFSPRVFAESPRVGQRVGYVKDLVCNVEAYPVPEDTQVAWSHTTNPVYTGGRFIIRTIPGAYNRVTSILTIVGVQPQDYGNYRCAATNEQGDGETMIELFATDQPTPDRTGNIVSGSSALVTSLTTVVMILSTCLLQRLNW